MTPAELLVLVETVIAARLSGDAFREYTEAGDRFKGESLADLRAFRKELQGEIQAADGGNFYLVELRDD